MPDWFLIHKFGEGCKTYIDKLSIQKNGFKAKGWVKYYAEPPGTDKINNKSFREIIMLEEYDCEQRKFCLHRIIFNYVDGTSGEPVSPVPAWVPATGGNEITLNYICQFIRHGVSP